jgi:integrase
MNHTMLQRRPSGYYFRQRVPDELRPVIGKNEIVRSLGTNDAATARRAVKLVAVEVDRLFDQARKSLQSPAVTPSEPFDASRILAEYLSASLEDDAIYRQSAGPITEDRLERDLEVLATQQIEAREALALRRPTFVAQRVASNLLADRPDVTEEEKRAFAFGVQQVILKGLEVSERRALGDWSDIVPAAPAPVAAPVPVAVQQPASAGGMVLTEALVGWMADRDPAKTTRAAWTAHVRRFVELHGDLSISSITRRQVAALREAVQADGGGVASQQKAVNALKSILGWAIENGHLDGNNPATGIRIRDPNGGRSDRQPFSAADIKAIFEATKGDTGARFWLPRLGLWTGARLGELVQLEVSDVRNESGIVYLDINDNGDHKSLKNAGSKRCVPIHYAAVQAGFLEYVASLDPSAALFPELPVGGKVTRSAAYSKIFSRLLDRIGLSDRRLVFHSLRHSFKDACRAAGLEEAVHDALTGHSGGGVGRRYGQGFNVERLAEEIDKVRF